MKAIVTKYHGPSNVRGSRYSATAEGGNRVIISADDRVGTEENHTFAALELCKRLDWKGELVPGGLPNGDTVFVFTGRDKDKPAYVTDPYTRHEYRCAVCGKLGPEHGHYNANDSTTHKFVCGER